MRQRTIKFRYVWQHEDTGNIAMLKYTLDQIANGVNGMDRHILISQDEFTGRLDKNGVEIYENDRLEWKHGEQNKEEFYTENGLVQYSGAGFKASGENLSDWYTENDNQTLRERLYHWDAHFNTPDMYLRNYDAEVVGNFYEDKESQ